MTRIPTRGSTRHRTADLIGAILVFAIAAAIPFQVHAQASTPEASPAIVSFADRTISGFLTGRDHQTYVEVPFEVPAGVERLTLDFDYDRADRTVIDLGLLDPNGLRGWSGGNKSTITVATSDATPSYVPGPVVAGEWRLLLGVPNIREGVTARWTARISLAGVDAPAPESAFFDGPIRSGAGWYRGDFHTHSGQSDGSCESLTGRRIPCPVFRTLERARAAELDFVAVTEHNTPSGFAELRVLQAY